jgi:1,4-dihydroxy-2-naphthoyl-CoA hydrolase
MNLPIAPIEQLNKFIPNTLLEVLGIKFEESTSEYIKASMPVDKRTHQPMGILHGGASVALAETIGSVCSNIILHGTDKAAVGLDINANHIKAVREGVVYAIAKPIHIGKTTHVWEIKITTEKNELVCVCRLTMMVINKK